MWNAVLMNVTFRVMGIWPQIGLLVLSREKYKKPNTNSDIFGTFHFEFTLAATDLKVDGDLLLLPQLKLEAKSVSQMVAIRAFSQLALGLILGILKNFSGRIILRILRIAKIEKKSSIVD